MAWWPFGKKKGSEGGPEAGADPAATPGAEAELAPTIAPGGDQAVTLAPGAPAPTIFVPPEFAQAGAPGGDVPFSSDMPTLAPQQIIQPGDPFGAADPFAQPGDPFAQPAGPDDFSKTMEDPDSPKKKKAPPIVRGGPPPARVQNADPFAAPPGRNNDFAQTLGDPDDDQRTIAPSYAQPQPQGQPADLFGSAEPHEQTLKMPAPPIRAAQPAAQRAAPATPNYPTYSAPAAAQAAEDRTFTAPPTAAHAQPPQAASAAPEENPMLAKTSALTPDKLRLGRALLAGGPITQERLQAELDKSGKSQSVLGKALLKSNFPREEELLAALVAQIRIPKINVRNTKIPLETIKYVPGEVAKKWKVLPIEKIGDILVIVSPGMGEEDALAAVRRATGCSIFPFQCDAEGFDEVLDGYYEKLAASGIAAPAPEGFAPPAPPPAPRPGPQPQMQPSPASGGPMAAIPGDADEWDRIYAAAGPVPAEEVLL